MGRHYAIVLAGGRSARMGVDKTRLFLEGQTLLERAVQACVGVKRIIVAGPPAILDPPHRVEFVLEEPPYAGPVAGLSAALNALSAGAAKVGSTNDDTVLVLACDLPRASDVVRLLQTAELGVDGTALVDEQGWPQYLAGRYRLASLLHRMSSLDQVRDLSMRRFVGPLELNLVPARAAITHDLDTPHQAEALGIDVHHLRRSPRPRSGT